MPWFVDSFGRMSLASFVFEPTTPLFMGSFLNFNAAPSPLRLSIHSELRTLADEQGQFWPEQNGNKKIEMGESCPGKSPNRLRVRQSGRLPCRPDADRRRNLHDQLT
jgi:hypothetical protein